MFKKNKTSSAGDVPYRRFPRVLVHPSASPMPGILGASVLWPTGEEMEIVDLSYSGVALNINPRLSAQPGQIVELKMRLAGQADVTVQAEVMRVTDRILALNFAALTAPARLALERFMQEKLIGLHVRSIDPKYFARPGSFTHWFHGPNDTNIFLWYEDLTLGKATIETGGGVLHWQNGRFTEGESESSAESEKGLTPLMARALEILTQVPDREQVLKPLLDALLEQRK